MNRVSRYFVPSMDRILEIISSPNMNENPTDTPNRGGSHNKERNCAGPKEQQLERRRAEVSAVGGKHSHIQRANPETAQQVCETMQTPS